MRDQFGDQRRCRSAIGVNEVLDKILETVDFVVYAGLFGFLGATTGNSTPPGENEELTARPTPPPISS